MSVHFREGDRITKGKLLVEIDDRDARNQLAMAEAGLAEAQSGREEVEKAIQAAKSAQTAANANASLTESTFKRFEELLKRKSVSQQEFDEIQAKRTAAQAEAQRAGEMLGAIEAKRMQVDAKITQAKVNLENASLYSSYFQIKAPFSGVVTQKSVEVGQLASPGIPLLTVEDPGSYRLEALVEESRIRTIKSGDPVPVQIDAVAGQIEGNVEEVLAVADPASRTVAVRISLPGALGLRSGMFGKARFPGGDRTVLMVSSSCLVSRGQLVGLFIVDDNSRARFRLIKPGRKIGEKTEILSGLEAGDKVVLSPDHEVSDGRQVRMESTGLNRIDNPVRNSGVNS
jgi:multidrug efflux pump subunit AcrA (membrane-fusion protein)